MCLGQDSICIFPGNAIEERMEVRIIYIKIQDFFHHAALPFQAVKSLKENLGILGVSTVVNRY